MKFPQSNESIVFTVFINTEQILKILLQTLHSMDHQMHTWRDLFSEMNLGLHDLLIAFEWNVATNHVEEENAERPHCGWNSTVPSTADPLWRTVDSRTWTKNITWPLDDSATENSKSD